MAGTSAIARYERIVLALCHMKGNAYEDVQGKLSL
jgi:hypothetical protein